MNRLDKLTQSRNGARRGLLALLGLLALAAISISPSQRAEAHEAGVCANKNWCERRSDTCGPANGYGKCLLTRFGRNICAEILFQVPNCAQCQEPNCTNCLCMLATGGGDKCNNGVNGYAYICARRTAQ